MPIEWPSIGLAHPLALLLLPAALPLLWLTARGRLRGLPGRRRRSILLLRAVLIAAIAVALAEPFVRQTEDPLALVLVLDASPSAGGAAAATARLDEALGRAGPRDRIAAVAFDREARILRPWPTPGAAPESAAAEPPAPPPLGDPRAGTPASAVNSALHLAAELAAHERNARIVLVTDGWTIEGSAVANRLNPPTKGRPVLTLPVSADLPDPETVAVAIEGPGDPGQDRIATRVDEPLQTTAVIATTVAQGATLHVFVDDRLTAELPVDLHAGVNRIPLEQRVADSGGTGVFRLAIEIRPALDTIPTNNRAETIVVTKPAGRVLILEERPGEGEVLQRALSNAGIEVQSRTPAQLAELPALAHLDAIVLANLPASSLSLDQMKTLQAFVSQRGGGLVAAGGRTTFSLGGYTGTPLEATLPLMADIPPRTEAATFALLLVLDRSGSMEAGIDGVKKIRMAAEAAVLASESVRSTDYIGVLAFDARNHWIVPVQRADEHGGLPTIQRQISALTADGGTMIFPAVKEALEAIRNVPTEARHMILLSDGQSTGDGDWDVLMADLKAAKVILSTVALGTDADQRLMSRLARQGEGRYYFTERARDLPRLITREAAVARQSPIVEGSIQPQLVTPSPILRSIAPSELPLLGGHIAASPKDGAEVILAADRGEPLLAQWHYGLGRAVAWTGGIAPDWAADWLAWPRFGEFWAQTVRWAMRPPVSSEFQPTILRDADRVIVRVDATRPIGDPAGPGFSDLGDLRAAVFSPDNRRGDLQLRQVAPGRYEAGALVGPPGSYLVEVAEYSDDDKLRGEWTGFVVHPEPESAHLGSNTPHLRRIATETGGRQIDDLSAAFDRSDLPPVQRDLPLWPWPLALAIVLLPVDIAARRLLS